MHRRDYIRQLAAAAAAGSMSTDALVEDGEELRVETDEEWFLLGMVTRGDIPEAVPIEQINDAIERDIEAEIRAARQGDIDLADVWRMHDVEEMWRRYG